jgi:hypothetical protein
MQALDRLASIQHGPNTGPQLHNAHVHLPPNFSAFDSLDEALNQAKSERLTLLGASNYYDYQVYEAFINGALDRKIYPILGMEIVTWIDELASQGVKINDPGNPGKAYLCGKGIVQVGSPNAKAAPELQGIRDRDGKRIAEMIDRIEKVLSDHDLKTDLTEQKITERVAARHQVPVDTVVLQERHVAMGFQEAIFELYPLMLRADRLERAFGKASKNADDPVGVQGELRSYLMKAGKAAYVAESFIAIDKACELIREIGGLPCYPVLADGAKPINGFEETPQTLIENLKKLNITTAEFIPNRNDPTVLEAYVLAMRQAGLIVAAGTEHNTLDKIALVPCCVGGAPLPETCQSIFWEAACVFAAHQHRVLNGRPGFESKTTRDEAWIKEFANEGATLIGGLI